MPKKIKYESYKYHFLVAARSAIFLPVSDDQPSWYEFIRKIEFKYENKSIVIEKMNDLVSKALTRKKARIATKPSKAAKEKRIEGKKKKSENKSFRKKIDHRNL